ncbi:MAG: RNA polymerase subunit sigma-70 [Thalassobius sp.]|nr:RNA polymerase subunit sigma-70 [Thalassovita sp.]
MKTAFPEVNSMTSIFEQYQPQLFPYAYNILGDFMEAEDLVQEVLNRFMLGNQAHVDNPKNYLIRSVINRAINQKKLLRKQKETYLGPWLPTPVTTEENIYQHADSQKIINYSLMVLLEHLSPKERAVFILKETYDFTHPEIAEILDIKIPSSRQLLKRAKEKLEAEMVVDQIHQPTFVSHSDETEIINQLTSAINNADIEAVKKLLSAEVKLVSDGGSKTSAARKIIFGKEDVIKLLEAIYGKYSVPNAYSQFAIVNHKPSLLYILDEKVIRCIVFEINKGMVEDIFVIINPDKLNNLNFFH